MRPLCFLFFQLFSIVSLAQNYLSTPLEYTPSKSSVNLPLIQKVMKEKQNEYDDSNKMDCRVIMGFLYSEANLVQSISNISSTMISSVSYYNYQNKGFVIAYLRNNQPSKPYVFCGITQQRWNYFLNYGNLVSWGESFQKFIYDQKCDCK